MQVGARDRWGSTALGDALRGDHVDCARLLGILDDLGEAPDAELVEVSPHASASRHLLGHDCVQAGNCWPCGHHAAAK